VKIQYVEPAYVYEGRRWPDRVEVTFRRTAPPEPGGKRLDPRNDIRNHSPAGFEWGYCGSGPAQLALALVVHHVKHHPEDLVRLRRAAGLPDVCGLCGGTGKGPEDDRTVLATVDVPGTLDRERSATPTTACSSGPRRSGGRARARSKRPLSTATPSANSGSAPTERRLARTAVTS